MKLNILVISAVLAMGTSGFAALEVRMEKATVTRTEQDVLKRSLEKALKSAQERFRDSRIGQEIIDVADTSSAFRNATNKAKAEALILKIANAKNGYVATTAAATLDLMATDLKMSDTKLRLGSTTQQKVSQLDPAKFEKLLNELASSVAEKGGKSSSKDDVINAFNSVIIVAKDGIASGKDPIDALVEATNKIRSEQLHLDKMADKELRELVKECFLG